MSVSTEAAEMLLMQTVLDWLCDSETNSLFDAPHAGYDTRRPTTIDTICDFVLETSEYVKEAAWDL